MWHGAELGEAVWWRKKKTGAGGLGKLGCRGEDGVFLGCKATTGEFIIGAARGW